MHKKQLIIENVTFDELTNALVTKLRVPEPKPTPEYLLLTKKEAAERLRVTTRTIHNYIKAGILPVHSFGNRDYIKSSEIENNLIRKEF